MGAGASTIPTETNAQLAAELAANASLPASKITPAVKEFAVRLKMALSTEDGWKELQELFKSLRASLDDAVSSEEWGSMMYQYDDLRYKYFGDVTPEEIIEQFNRLDDEGKSQLSWEEFVDGAISLSAAVMLSDALATPEGELELKELFDLIEPDEDGRILLGEFGIVLKESEDVLSRYLGLDANTSTRFRAFFMTGRVDTWIGKTFRRLGFHEDDVISWDEFIAGGRATGA